MYLAFFSDSWPAMCIHGDKSQPERDWVLNGEFKTKHCPYSVFQG